MAFTKIQSHILITILIFPLFIQSAFAITTPLYNICSTSQNFTSNTPYARNLKKLLGELHFKTPPTGFGLGSAGRNPDRVYGLSLCRGDVSPKDCETCVVEAGIEILKRCPNHRGTSIIWYDNCFLKYSDVDFFGKIDGSNRFYMWNLKNVSDPEEFNMKTRDLLVKLSVEASETTKLFAYGDVGLMSTDGSEKIYGMAQCSRDVSRGDCKKCLDDAVNELPRCCGGKRGGRVVGGSCNIRYEIYPFLNFK